MENVGEGEKESDLAIQFNLEAGVPPRDFRGVKNLWVYSRCKLSLQSPKKEANNYNLLFPSGI